MYNNTFDFTIVYSRIDKLIPASYQAALSADCVNMGSGTLSIQMTFDTYSHVVPDIQEAAAEGFYKMLDHKVRNEAIENVGSLFISFF